MNNSTIRKILDIEQQFLIDTYSPLIKELTDIVIRLETNPDEDDIEYSVKKLKNRIAKCKKIAFSPSSYRDNIEKIIHIIDQDNNKNDHSPSKIY